HQKKILKKQISKLESKYQKTEQKIIDPGYHQGEVMTDLVPGSTTIELNYNKAKLKKGSYLVTQGKLVKYADDTDSGAATTFGIVPGAYLPVYALLGEKYYGDHFMVFGGYLETDASYVWGDNFNNDIGKTPQPYISVDAYGQGFDMALTSADLYLLTNLNEWVSAFFGIDGADITDPYLEYAFVTFGHLGKSPLFVTVGKSEVPTGVWAGGGPWTASLTSGYFQPSQFTNAMLSYYDNGLNISIAGFALEDQSSTGSSATNNGNFMAGMFYSGTVPDTTLGYGFNIAYIFNWANTGMAANNGLVRTFETDPVTGLPTNTVASESLEPIQSQNSMINIEGHVTHSIYGVYMGWSGLTEKADYTNNGFAGAWYIQLTTSPIMFDEVTTFGLTWSQSYNTNNMFFSVPGQEAFGPQLQGVNKEIIAFVQRPILTPQVLLGLELSWLGLPNNEYTSALTMDLSVYF
ncbi:DUF3573 domain-containing protein, partial [Francisellaceae bacterium]|nr:DUF3573 domain-containing protein [Francisellaceae bacterium]